MKLYHIIIGSAVMASLVLAGTGCSKILDIEKHGVLSTKDTFYKTDGDVESAVAAMYKTWRSDYSVYMETLNALGDDMWTGGTSSTMRSDFRNINNRLINADNSAVKSFYTALYEEIYYANLIIDNVSEDSEVKVRARAEAKFVRAFANFYLGLLWGQTVPLVDHVLNPSEYHIGRCEEGARWALIEQDLGEAVKDLPARKGVDDRETFFRVCKEAAQVMLGKAYLWQGKYKEAAGMFDSVISSGKYDLYRGGYTDLFHADDNYNTLCERVLAFYVPDDKENYRTNGINSANDIYFYGDTPSKIFTASPLREDGKNLYMNSGRGMWGPREGLYNAFVEMEGTDGKRLRSSIVTTEQMVEEMGFSLTKSGTVYNHDNYWSLKSKPYLSDVMEESLGGSMTSNIKIPFSFIRYSEVLLLGAEASLLSGGGKADEYLNKVRARAGLPSISGATLENIQKEKRLELCQEGTRYLDLVRWNLAKEYLGDQGKEIRTLGIVNKKVQVTTSSPYASVNPGLHEDWQLVLPIPTTEIMCNPANPQNEGYDVAIVIPSDGNGGGKK